jgi:hypothetical protein
MDEAGERRTYYVTAKELPVSIALADLTYIEATQVAGMWLGEGQVLIGPDEGPEGWAVTFDNLHGVKITHREPAGPLMRAPKALVEECLKDADEDIHHHPDAEEQ